MMHEQALPGWMRNALFATAAMNMLAAVVFLPPAHALRALAGFPEADDPLYLTMVALFVLLFGLAYLGYALRGHADRLFIALAAVGKLSFVALLVAFWSAGAVPVQAPLSAAGDLVFGVLFFAWLYGSPAAFAADTASLRRARG
jgi:hypothetical protein